MYKRSIFIALFCLVSMLFVGQVLAQDACPTDGVTLRYKFAQGDVLRYKMVMDMDLTMNMAMPEGQQIPPMTMRMVMIHNLKVNKILENGDAELGVNFESMKMEMQGMSQELPMDMMPALTYVMSPTGEVKDIKGMENLGMMQAQMPMMNMNSMGQSSIVLPADPVKEGDTWTQEVPFPMGEGKILSKNTMIDSDAKVGSYVTAAFKQDVNGDFKFDLPVPVPQGEGQAAPPKIGMGGKVAVKGTTYFSPEKGQVIRSVGSGGMSMAMDISGAPEGQPASMAFDAKLKFEMFLLPASDK